MEKTLCVEREDWTFLRFLLRERVIGCLTTSTPSIAKQRCHASPLLPLLRRLPFRATMMLARRSIAPCAVARPCPNGAASKAAAPAKSRRIVGGSSSSSDLHLLSSLAPVALLAAADGAAPRGLEKYFTNLLQGQADTFSALGLPEPLVHWGHPGNMAVVLVAMGLYGSGYLGWSLRLSNDETVVAKAKDLHPKLAIGMTLFFAAGALGGLMSLLMQGKPLTQSPHFITGSVGLLLLTFQGMLSAFFEDDPGLRGAHAYFGTAILALFVVHAVFGLQLGLSI